MVRVFPAAALLLCAACAGAPPPRDIDAELKPCPKSRNCVSSLASDQAHRAEPLALRGSAAEGLAAVRQVILAMPRSRIAAEGPGYLRAEFKSLILRVVDDVEVAVDAAAGVIHIRSAARVGAYDFGVNRRRVAEIRARLAAQQPQAADKKR